jgi:hypothetical protein
VVTRLPGLEARLGASPEAVTLSALQLLVDDRLPEAADLEFKQTLYDRTERGRQNLATDVAAMANAAGGVIVLGIAEADGRAGGPDRVRGRRRGRAAADAGGSRQPAPAVPSRRGDSPGSR